MKYNKVPGKEYYSAEGKLLVKKLIGKTFTIINTDNQTVEEYTIQDTYLDGINTYVKVYNSWLSEKEFLNLYVDANKKILFVFEKDDPAKAKQLIEETTDKKSSQDSQREKELKALEEHIRKIKEWNEIYKKQGKAKNPVDHPWTWPNKDDIKPKTIPFPPIPQWYPPIQNPIQQPPYWLEDNRPMCNKCGIDLSGGVIHFVCPNGGSCPTGLGGVSY